MSLLAFRQVSKRFPDGTRQVAVLDRVSFEVYPGEKVGLHGSRKAGKSTLLRIAAGLLAPDEGQVIWNGEHDLASCDENQRARVRRLGGIALARGDVRVIRSTTVLDHLMMPLYSMNLPKDEAERAARHALELVDALRLSYQVTGQLGLRDRLIVDLARAVVKRPRLLLVDEPAVLAQPQEARAFYRLLHDLADRIGCALLIASEEPAALHGLKPMMSLSGGKLDSTTSKRKVVDFPVAGRHGGREAS
jgi:lipoprotein-releasing system ATP-binding protein